MIKACKKYLTAFKTGIDHLEVVFLSYTYTYTYLLTDLVLVISKDGIGLKRIMWLRDLIN